MLVATSLASDTRVLREARTLADAGHQVHVIGKQVPPDWQPPDGISASSAGASSMFRAEGAPSLGGRRLSAPVRIARWLMLPTHRNQAFGRWAQQAARDAADRAFDVVHAHDYTALEVGAALADERGVPFVYDSHELWGGRPRVGRPTPAQTRHEGRVEALLGGRAACVITVGEGVAAELRRRYGWDHVTVVRNTFALPDPLPGAPTTPTGAVYAGRLAPYRELEAIAVASRRVDLPITLVGPADSTWLAGFDPGRASVRPPLPVDDVDGLLTAAGLALVTHSDRWANHRLAMPNKLFHAVRAGVPVVATDVGELGRLVREHEVGRLYRPGDGADLARAIEKAVEDYPALVAAVHRAAPSLSWESDAAALLGVYQRLPVPGASRGR
jgi:glycosyltransferase involved in cell wall biosynthesis